MLRSSELYTRLFEALPEPKYLGKLDGLPEGVRQAYVIVPGGVPVEEGNSTLTFDASVTAGRLYNETVYVDIRVASHREDWVPALMDLRDDIIRVVNDLNIPTLTLQSIEEPELSVGDLDYIELRTSWLHKFYL